MNYAERANLNKMVPIMKVNTTFELAVARLMRDYRVMLLERGVPALVAIKMYDVAYDRIVQEWREARDACAGNGPRWKGV